MTEKLGGIISVQSTDKEGTTFTLTFKNVNAS
jgi:signal transduction histidine kinase